MGQGVAVAQADRHWPTRWRHVTGRVSDKITVIRHQKLAAKATGNGAPVPVFGRRRQDRAKEIGLTPAGHAVTFELYRQQVEIDLLVAVFEEGRLAAIAPLGHVAPGKIMGARRAIETVLSSKS